MNYEMFAIIGILLYIINVKEENIMDIKETKLNDGTILTPIESLFSKEQTQKLSEMINSPEYQNYAANQMQKQLYEKLGLDKKPDLPKNIMVEKQSKTNELIELTNEQIWELQNQLKDSKVQLKQANDKISSQTLVIKQLKADLKEEGEMSGKISSKDWKGWIISAIIGALIPIIIQTICKIIL